MLIMLGMLGGIVSIVSGVMLSPEASGQVECLSDKVLCGV